MCGIVGYTGSDEAKEKILDGLVTRYSRKKPLTLLTKGGDG
jgi:hypothetical protein